MQDSNIENTQPNRPSQEPDQTVPTRVQREPIEPPAVEVTRPVQTSTPPPPPGMPPSPVAAAKPARRKRWPWILLGILMVLVFGGAGGWVGYRTAVQMRKAQQEEQRVTLATEHFMLGMQAQTNKQYQIAQQQFEYVLRLDSNFPGAQDKLREVMIAMAVKESPTPAPTVAQPTLTPTVDTRPQEEILNQAKQQYAAKDWTNLFTTIDSLRKIDPTYHSVEIDDMLYVALRYRGIDKILVQRNLEGGLYDLALAEKFGPLDVDSLGYRNWARQYINGSTFWEVDWAKVMTAFEQIYPYFPNMSDSSGMTAIERYRIAAKGLGDKLSASGDACGAYDNYQKSLKAVPDSALEPTAQAAYLICYPPTGTPTPTTVVTTAVPVATTPPAAATTPPAEATTPPAAATSTNTPETPTAGAGGGG